MTESDATKAPARLVEVAADQAERRLDNFLLGELKGLPRARIYRMIRTGEVRVNKGRARPTTRLETGDIVRIPPLRLEEEAGTTCAPRPAKAAWILERIVYEDEALLVLDKPAGLAVHGGSGIALGAIELLRAARPESHYLELVHRLDRDTSGILLIAKKRSSLRRLHEQLRDGTVGKWYLALLLGRWRGGAREVDLPLVVEHRQGGERHVRTGADGKPARSRFVPEQVYATTTLCTVEIFTGRTHQIRVHAAAIGHPLAGDSRYGRAAEDPRGLRRLFLHAHRIEFDHPRSGERISFEAPLPPELRAVLEQLDIPGSGS